MCILNSEITWNMSMKRVVLWVVDLCYDKLCQTNTDTCISIQYTLSLLSTQRSLSVVFSHLTGQNAPTTKRNTCVVVTNGIFNLWEYLSLSFPDNVLKLSDTTTNASLWINRPIVLWVAAVNVKCHNVIRICLRIRFKQH